MLAELGKLMVLFGIFMVIAGVFFILPSNFNILGKLPGDIAVKRGNYSLYVPLTTSLILSIVLSILVTVYSVLRR